RGVADIALGCGLSRCRGAKVVVTSLDRLPQGAHCPSCDVDYDRDFSQNVELTFEPAPDIRMLGSGTYCLASQLAAEHIRVQHWLAPGQVETMEIRSPTPRSSRKLVRDVDRQRRLFRGCGRPNRSVAAPGRGSLSDHASSLRDRKGSRA